MPNKFLKSITLISGRVQAVDFQPISVDDLPSGFALLGAANTFTLGPQTIRTGGDALRALVLKYNSATQTGNPLEVLTSGDVKRGAIAIQSTVNDPLAFELRPGATRSYYFGTREDAGYFKFMRSDSAGFLAFEPGVGLMLMQGAGAYAYLRTESNSFIVVTAREDGGDSTVDFNRRPTDNSTGVGGRIRLWTKTGQTLNALEVLTPGGAGLRLAVTPAGNLQQWEDSSTANRQQAAVISSWATATDASRKARSVWSVFDTAEREGLRIEASGTAPMIGVLGAAAIARQHTVAITNFTSDVTYDCNATTLDEVADSLATLWKMMIDFGFAGGTVT